MKIKQEYQQFMREKIDEKYLNSPYTEVLAENFIDNLYFVVYEIVTTDGIIRRFLLITNIKKDILIELNQWHHDEGYIIFGKSNLRKNVPDELYQKLAERGLYGTKNNALKTNSKPFLLSRLVCCVYQNILNLEVHHIHSNLILNDVNSLLPIDVNTHAWIHSLLDDERMKIVESIQLFRKKRIFNNRWRVQSDDDLILNILDMKSQNMKPKQIEVALEGKVKKSTLYTHLNYFYYHDEFLCWREERKKYTNPPVFGNYENTWLKALEFNAL